MKNFWNHFRTITRHRHMVIRHCFKAGIPLQGLLHDLSKYSPSEFFVGAKFYQGNKSPNEGEREAYGYSKAWMHHKGRNKHHYEYWTDYSLITRAVAPVKMPVNYLVEMFCDRVAASKIYLKDKYTDRSPLEYFLRSKGRRVIHPETSRELENLLTMLAEHGEEHTFAYIKTLVKTNKRKEDHYQ
jgi:hypothetical protein